MHNAAAGVRTGTRMRAGQDWLAAAFSGRWQPSRAAPTLAKPASVGRRGAQDSQVTPAANFNALSRRLSRGARRGRLADRVGQCLKIVCVHRLILGLASRQPDYIPAARCGHPVRVAGAQVIAMWLDEGGKRPENRSGVTVDVRQRVQGSLPAGWPGALASGQLITPVSYVSPAHGNTCAPGASGRDGRSQRLTVSTSRR